MLVSIHPVFWWSGIAGVALFINALLRSTSLKPVVWGSLMVGTMKAAGGTIWVLYTYPLVWLGLSEGLFQMVLIGTYWGGVSLLLGSTLVVVGVLGWWLIKKNSFFIFVLPIVWVLAEIASSVVFSIYSLGPGSYINGYFSFGYIGYALTDITFFHPLAVIGGVYALSFFTTLFGVILYLLLTSRPVISKKPVVTLLLISFITVFGARYLIPSPVIGGQDTKVITVNTRFTAAMLQEPEGNTKKRAAVEKALEQAAAYNPDVIIFPEDTRLIYAHDSLEAALEHMEEVFKERPVLIIDSARVRDTNDETVFRALVFDTGTGTVYFTDKQYLVPHGEYVPYFVTELLTRFGSGELLEKMERAQSYRPGRFIGYDNFPDQAPGILFCFESASPFGVRKVQTARQAPFVTHLVSHAWFYEPTILWLQLNRMLRVQALWNQTPIVSAANMAEGHLYTSDGRIEKGKYLKKDEYWQLYEYAL